MPDAPLPEEEADRIAVLYSLGILDTPPEERFDRITRAARMMFAVPIALIGLVDAGREWFKARDGLALAEIPRADSFSAHAILSKKVLQVPDATQDVRFATNPLVAGPEQV